MTALGLNNYGKPVYRYGLETVDVDEKGEEVFRESDSTFFCRVRDLFANELKAMYNTLESKNAWHAESFINKGDAWQSEFPEELWRIDIDRKYIRTYNSSFINGEGDAQFLTNMATGKMKYHRRQWERSQEKYMASKYQSSVASSDNSVFRCTVPNGNLVVKPNYRLKLTPYAYMYLNVKYGTQNPIQLRAEPNVVYEIPFDGEKTDIVDVYSSSLIQDFGDLSTCYVATADTTKASKVKKLIFGNSTAGYDNPSFTTLTTGANYLLEELNIENVSGLTQSLDLTALNNLKNLYAHGSNIGGVSFADGGRIEIAELPAINAMTMKNLIYLTTLDVADFSKLTTLTVENCNTVDLLTILDAATSLNRIRITGIDWRLNDTSLLERLYGMKGIDKNGYNADRSVVAGTVHVPVIREQQFREYNDAWPDLEIKYNTMINQFSVTFVNHDGTVLDVQYIDKGEMPVDPVTRQENPIAVPTKESTVSHNFTYAGWDSDLIAVFEPLTYTATYTATIRTYTVRHVSMGTTLQTRTAEYGTMVFYEGETPTYTAEESAYRFYLFTGWDQSGLVTGDKTINAVYDSCAYTAGYFKGKDISTMRPVEIYTLIQMGLEQDYVDSMDEITFSMGQDIDYPDVESIELISTPTVFNGSNHIDTGISLLSEDRSFVIALDYEFASGNTTRAVLAQCFQYDGSNGFKLLYNANPMIQWGTTTQRANTGSNREMLIIRHVAGEDGLHIYNSNLVGSAYVGNYANISRDRSSITNATLVFGCEKADDGAYENFAKGTIHWAKLWYTDLGDNNCRDLASYIHEEFTMQMCGFKRKYLSNNSSKRASMSFLAKNAMYLKRPMNTSSTNVGGWGATALNTWLNTHFYNGLPLWLKQLIKQVRVNSSIGDKSLEVQYSNCYVYLPAIVELDSSMSDKDPYGQEDTTIDYMVGSSDRIRTWHDGQPVEYWTRSPNANYSAYFYKMSKEGSSSGIETLSTSLGVVIEFSI